jgi:2-polyprenyl-6-methoxyphenol hydroxylase-like FAD-dependent oxidoreductase
MPNSFLPPSMQGLGNSLQGAILVGDAWNMRHPLTGGGMTVAFHDAVLLTQYLRPDAELPAGREGLERWDVISDRLKDWFWARKNLAGTVNVLSVALYDLFGGIQGEHKHSKQSTTLSRRLLTHSQKTSPSSAKAASSTLSSGASASPAPSGC